jgi:hypothetical protein
VAVVAEEEAGVEASAEENGSSSVDNDGGDWRSTERRELREFWDESEMTRGRLLFIGSKISAVILSLNRC